MNHGLQHLAEFLSALPSLPSTWYVASIVQFVLAGLLMYAGAEKILHPDLAAGSARNFGLVSRAETWQGYAVGVAELTLGALIVVQPMRPWVAAVLSLGVYSFFAGLVALALWRGKSFPCNCLGPSSSDLSRRTLIRSLTLVVANLVVVLAAVRIPSGIATEKRAQTAVIAVALVAAIVAVGVARKARRLAGKLELAADLNWIRSQVGTGRHQTPEKING